MSASSIDPSLYRNVELEAKVSSASPYELVQLLFDELILLLARAKEAQTHDDKELQNVAVERATHIISYLHSTLSEDVESDLPHKLSLLYDYINRQLLSYRLRSDEVLLDEVISLVETIASAWKNISANV